MADKAGWKPTILRRVVKIVCPASAANAADSTNYQTVKTVRIVSPPPTHPTTQTTTWIVSAPPVNTNSVVKSSKTPVASSSIVSASNANHPQMINKTLPPVIVSSSPVICKPSSAPPANTNSVVKSSKTPAVASSSVVSASNANLSQMIHKTPLPVFVSSPVICEASQYSAPPVTTNSVVKSLKTPVASSSIVSASNANHPQMINKTLPPVIVSSSPVICKPSSAPPANTNSVVKSSKTPAVASSSIASASNANYSQMINKTPLPPVVVSSPVICSDPDFNVNNWDINGSQVKVFGLPFGITEDLLCDLINKKIIELGLSSQDEAYRCEFENEGSQYWAVLHFVSAKEAGYCAALDGMSHNGATLKFVNDHVDACGQDLPSCSVAPSEMKSSSSSSMASSPSAPKFPGADEATSIFIKAMLLNRYFRGSQICVDYRKMVSELKANNIHVSENYVKARKRSLLVYYESIAGGPKELGWSHSEGIKAFLNDPRTLPRWDDEGWRVEETLTLIDEYIERKPVMDCPTVRHDTVWAEIVRALRVAYPERSQKFNHASVLAKWDRIFNFFNKIEDSLRRTGETSQHMQWPYYDAMSLHFSKSVTSNPEFTFSAGVQHRVHQRSRDCEDDPPPSKRPRVSAALRKQDLNTRRVEAQETLAQAFLKVATQLEKRNQNQ